MSIFGDLDLESAADDPFAVEDGTYEATIVDATVKPTKDESKIGLTLVYQITDDGPMNGRKVSEWKHIPKSKDEEGAENARSYLKQRLLSIGIPASRLNTFEPEDAKGIDVIMVVKNNESNGRTYTNVQRVSLPDEGGSSDAGNAFASL